MLLEESNIASSRRADNVEGKYQQEKAEIDYLGTVNAMQRDAPM